MQEQNEHGSKTHCKIKHKFGVALYMLIWHQFSIH